MAAGPAMTKVGVATQILHGIGAPINSRTLGAMVGWFNAEGGHWNNGARFNPLNTTQGAPGAGSINSVGVKSYNNWAQGINSTIQTLKNGNYGQIIQAFHNSDPQGVAHAIAASPWGTSGSLVGQTIGAAVGMHLAPPPDSARGIAQGMMASGSSPVANTTTSSRTVPALSVEDALAESMLNASTGHGGNILSGALNLIDQAGTKTVTDQNTTFGTGPSLRNGGFHGGLQPQGPNGDVNPLGPGWILGRTDMGVDANAKPGTPIRAINDSVVRQILPNWYAGQPLVLLQLTSGPNAGRYWYVAEQISHGLHVGQTIQRGQTVATYAHSGTGIEIGWGSPTSNSRTLAGQEGNTGGAGHANSPAGAAFRRAILHA